MAQKIINLKAIRFEVEDINDSIQFFEALGWKVALVEGTEDTASVYLRVGDDQCDVTIHLYKDYARHRELTPEEKLPTFEIIPNINGNNFFEEGLELLEKSGLVNVCRDDNGGIQIGIIYGLNDPNGTNWEYRMDYDWQERMNKLR